MQDRETRDTARRGSPLWTYLAVITVAGAVLLVVCLSPGWYFGRPMTPEQATAWLAERHDAGPMIEALPGYG